MIERRGPAALATHVLGAEAATAIHRSLMAERKWLVDASTGGRDGYRLAQLLYTPVDEAQAVSDWIGDHLERLCRTIGIAPFVPARTEMQMTVHEHGGFYKPHRDDQGPEVAQRTLSYVYYFHRLPKAFEGGELVLESTIVEPTHDTLIVFPSQVEHEVRDVRIPSRELSDGRCTVNGWLWRTSP